MRAKRPRSAPRSSTASSPRRGRARRGWARQLAARDQRRRRLALVAREAYHQTARRVSSARRRRPLANALWRRLGRARERLERARNATAGHCAIASESIRTRRIAAKEHARRPPPRRRRGRRRARTDNNPRTTCPGRSRRRRPAHALEHFKDGSLASRAAARQKSRDHRAATHGGPDPILHPRAARRHASIVNGRGPPALFWFYKRGPLRRRRSTARRATRRRLLKLDDAAPEIRFALSSRTSVVKLATARDPSQTPLAEARARLRTREGRNRSRTTTRSAKLMETPTPRARPSRRAASGKAEIASDDIAGPSRRRHRITRPSPPQNPKRRKERRRRPTPTPSPPLLKDGSCQCPMKRDCSPPPRPSRPSRATPPVVESLWGVWTTR